ncbi:hypothetical protein BJV82DRAFT_606563 [Fennellomyces sp. T-0311]|nr:hypothetical protein BJV82DRAFT_606563 [Fennellomyces sp. T-0311]
MKFTFVPNKEPCAACKTLRKKCVRQNGDTGECDRCIKKGEKCVTESEASSLSDSSELSITEDSGSELQDWCAVVAELDSKIGAIEADLEQSLVQVKRQAPVEWKLGLLNGTIQLETPIRTMEELFIFTQASIRYLSPFSGLFIQRPVRFQSTSISISLGVSSEVQRKELINPRRSRFSTLDYNKEFTKLSASFDHRIVVNGLVMLYLEHYNPCTGFLHRPTFLQQYYALDDPMDSALTIAVCIDALFTLLHMLTYTPDEIRMLADMFYIRCRDLLFDMYDDPKQKLNVVLVTSLIQKYVADVRLNDLEANRLVTIGLLVCTDLAQYRTNLTPVEWVLFQRSYFRLKVSNLSHTVIHNSEIDISVPEEIKDMDVLDDESEKTKKSIRMTNEIIRLIGSPYISYLLGKVTNIFYGRPCDILLEDIVRFEATIKGYWNNLLAIYRICDDPFDPYGYKLVQGKVDPCHLLPFVVLHIVTGLITSSILQPHVIPSSENSAVAETIQVIKIRLRTLAVNSCRVLVHALNDNWVPSTDHIPYCKPQH